MRPLPPPRYLLLTLAGAAVNAAAGAMLIYLTYLAWQDGECSMRGSVLRLADSPIAFSFVTGLEGLFGTALLFIGTPLMLGRLFAGPEGRRRQEASAPWLYGRTRPSLVWMLAGLLAFVSWALLARLFA